MAEIGKDIHKAKTLLEQGELVAIPTETVYGLSGNALNVSAIAKIFQVKDRPHFDPLIVHVPDFDSVKSFVSEIPEQAKLLANHFWPGPLTILLPRKPIIPDLVTSGLGTVGIRCPAHSLTIDLLRSLSFPLAAPSANPFGYISPTKASHVNDQLGEKIQYILDGGNCEVGIESTIVGFENNIPTIYRMGGLSIEMIESIIGKVNINLDASSNPTAPGQLKSHYAPHVKLVVGKLNELLPQFATKNIGVLPFQEFRKDVVHQKQRVLSTRGDMAEAAQNLFSCLRQLDQLNLELIVAEEVPDVGLGKAINDRLRRAAAPIDDL
jgi:L-threonylcarbamoyladenylate synthase